MTILQEIVKWSQTLPDWQQHAVAKLYVAAKLSPDEVDEIPALLKAEHEIPDAQGRSAKPLAAGAVVAARVPGRRIQLTAIKNLQHVNALAEGQRVAINPDGLTVIYGENGSGKSGYSRVLKRDCRARVAREDVLPDATKAPAQRGTPRAVFELLVDGVSVDVEWIHGTIKRMDREITAMGKEARKARGLQEKLDAQRALRVLAGRRNEKKRLYFEEQDRIKADQDGLVAGLEKRLSERTVKVEDVMTLKWRLVAAAVEGVMT